MILALSLFAVSERTHKVLFYPLGYDPLLLLFLYLKYPGLDFQAGFPVLLICPRLFFRFFFSSGCNKMIQVSPRISHFSK